MNILGMNIDWFKFLILLIVGLVVVGPEKLPSYARKAAKVIRNIDKVTKVVTGQITEALNMNDDEGGKAPGFKNDLMAVKRSLEADVAELKAALDSQAKAITETVEAGTTATAAIAKEISETVNTQVTDLNTTLQEQARTVAATLESGTAPLTETSQPVVEKAPVVEETQTQAPQALQQENPETSPQPLAAQPVGTETI